ncbi:MAG: SBBP repeat-containing protein [Thermoanaerobaculia bacterium]|nr:SBBP repeat-containing protein [Thermoanaerobaculia bacterium]
MKPPVSRWILLFTGTLLLSAGAERALAGPAAQTSKVPLYFEPNLGQTAPGFEFLARGEGYLALVKRDGITLRLMSGRCGEPARKGPLSRDGGASGPETPAQEAPCATETATLRIEGGMPHARVIPEQKLEGISNYLIGNDSSRWLTHIPQYGAIRIEGVYPGIDLVLRPNGTNLRYDFEVFPGADPGKIRLRMEGAERTEVAGERLIHHMKRGQLEQRDLRVSQGAESVAGARFAATPDGRIGFDVPVWNRREKLVIDPTFSWGTYLGGYGPEDVRGLAIDSAGNAYVTGLANNPVFPVTAGAFSTVHAGGYDAFVTKLNAAGTALVYSTFLGGEANDYGIDIAVDASGSAYVTGETRSTGFPVTAGAFDMVHGGDLDAFVTKLNAAGTGLVYSTYLGDSVRDSGFSIAVDGSGNAHVTGTTTSAGFPVTAGVVDGTHNGVGDVFVTKVNATGTALLYSTFLGGIDDESGRGIAIDGSGNAYLTGETRSAGFPVVAGGFDTTHNGDYDVFMTKLNATGTSLTYSTFVGGAGADYTRGIALDATGNAYVTGYTGSAGYPATVGAFDTVQNGDYDAFVTKLNAAGTALVYSTFLGDTGPDHGNGIAVDSAGRAHVTGYTASIGFPVTAGALDTVQNGDFDVFVTKLDAAGALLAFSTFLGGAGYEGGDGIAVDTSGNVFVTGQTRSNTFPVTGGAYQTVIGGDFDVFVSKIAPTGDFFSYSTFLGGPGSTPASSFARAIAVDGSGNAYVTGPTGSAGFPVTAGAYITAYGLGIDAFVTKLNPAGTGVVYSTYLGGTDLDEANGIAVDASGNAYVAGSTLSAGFPTTAGALDTTPNGGWDAFVTKLNPTGAGLVFSTFLGGAGQDQSRGIAVDTSLNVYVTGETWSASFPVTAGAYDISHNGSVDVFVSKIAPAGGFFTYSTFLGSPAQDDAGAIAVDAAGSAYVTGFTFSSLFPTTAGAYDTSYGGGGDAFVTKLNATGSGLDYSTFLGGGDVDYGKAVAVDAFWNAYVTGWTLGLGFPTTAGAYDTSHNGGFDVFVTKLNVAGNALLYSTFAGGSSDDMGRGIALDGPGNAHVTGSTNGAGFPVTAGAFDTGYNGNGDAFFVQLNAAGAGLLYSTFLGGTLNDYAHAIVLGAGGSVWLAGETGSQDFPATPGAFQSSAPSTMISGFVARFVSNVAPVLTPVVSLTVPRGATTNALIATVTDPDTAPPALSVSATGAPAGVTVANFVLTPTGPGTYNVTADIIAACNAAATGPVNLEATDGIALPVTGSFTLNTTDASATATLTGGATLCLGDNTTLSVALTGVAPWSLTWSDGFVQSGISVSPAARVVSPAVTTTYTISTVSGANACGGTASGSALVTVNPLPTSTLSGGATLCEGDSTTLSVALTGTSPWSLTWSDGFVQSGIAASPAARAVSPAVTTTYTITVVSDATGCSGTASGSALVTVNPRPTATVTGGGTICAGTVSTVTAALTGTAPWTVTWNDGLVQIVVASPATRQVSPTFNQTFAVLSLSDAKCAGGTSTGVAAFVVKPVPSAVITAANGICFSSTGNSASVPDGGIGTTYAWGITGGTITSATNTKDVTYTANASGNVVLTVTVTKDGCPNVGTKTIPIQTLPQAPAPLIPADGLVYSGAFVSWAHAGGTYYDVYLDTVYPPEKLIFSGETSNFEAMIPSWVTGVTYYWQVVARNGCGTASGPVHSFVAGSCLWTGAAPVLTNPVNGVTGVGTTANLTWDEVPGTAHYDIYVGTSMASLLRHGVAPAPQTSFAFTVSPGVTYYWHVTAVPVCGSAMAVTSETNTFTAAGSPFGASGFAPGFFNRWETGTVTLSGSGFTSGMELFTDFGGASAGTLIPAVFTNSSSNPNQLQATLIGNPAAGAGRYDVGVTLSGIEEGRLLQAMALRAFTDVTENDYYYLSSGRIVDAGIMEPDFDGGTPGPQFSPVSNVSRARMADYLAKSYQYWRYRTTGLPAAVCVPSGSGSTDFPDVACNHPDWLAIHWIKAWGVTNGVPCAEGTCYSPDGTVTRAEMVTFLERLRQTGVLNTLLSTVGETDPGCAAAYPGCKGWTDAGGVMDVAGWPRREANLAFADRITAGCAGTPGNGLKFCPSDLVTRAQIAEFLGRILGLVPMP